MSKTDATGRRSKLTARFVETVAKPGKYHDGGGAGLFLRVMPNGSRQWVQRITIHGKRKELGLGSPPAVSLATARKLALDNRGKAMLGGDPLAERRKHKDSLTFAQAVDRYLAAKLQEFRNEKHRQQWRSTLDTYAGPVIGAQQLPDISVSDILRVLEPIWTTKTETASRLRGRIENVLSWATVSGFRTDENPARWKGNLSELLPNPAKVAKRSNHPALSPTDVTGWWDDLSDREGMGAQALRFVALTAKRSKEVRGARWDEIDFGVVATSATSATRGAIWNIPAIRMKNKRDHREPLTDEAVALLRALPRLEGSPLIFFAPRGGMLSDMSFSAVMRRMQEAKIKAGEGGYLDPISKRPAVPHGLRSTFRQWAAEQGYPRDMAEIALAHLVGSEVERAYQRSDMLERRRAMMAAWGSFLCGRASDGAIKSPALDTQ